MRKEATVAFSQMFPCMSLLPSWALLWEWQERRLMQVGVAFRRRGEAGVTSKGQLKSRHLSWRHLRCSGSGCVNQNSELYLSQKRVWRCGHFTSPGCFRFCAPTGGWLVVVKTSLSPSQFMVSFRELCSAYSQPRRIWEIKPSVRKLVSQLIAI